MEHVVSRCQEVRAFTLVELLVVVGIIGLLIAILLPTLIRARESTVRVSCAKNMQQIAAGMVMFLNDKKGVFPVPPVIGAPTPHDALFWQSARRDEIGFNGLGPYLKITPKSLNLFRCPGDLEAGNREASGKYPFTFSFNDNMNGTGLNTVRKVSQVRNPSEKILLIEENGPLLNDGSVTLWTKRGNWAAVGMLGLRHDRGRRVKYPDAASDAAGITNPAGQANCLFVDGHVAYVPRSYAHSKSHALPNPELFPDEPELGP